MSTWWWVIVGTGLLFALSVMVGLAIAAVLGRVGREISELFEIDHWASAPLARDADEEEVEQEARSEGRSSLQVPTGSTKATRQVPRR